MPAPQPHRSKLKGRKYSTFININDKNICLASRFYRVIENFLKKALFSAIYYFLLNYCHIIFPFHSKVILQPIIEIIPRTFDIGQFKVENRPLYRRN